MDSVSLQTPAAAVKRLNHVQQLWLRIGCLRACENFCLSKILHCVVMLVASAQMVA